MEVDGGLLDGSADGAEMGSEDGAAVEPACQAP